MAHNEYKSAAPSMPRSGDSITSGTTYSCSSNSDEQPDFHSSFVSAITMDDCLGISDRFAISDRYQHRLDPRLHSLAEQKRASGASSSAEFESDETLPLNFDDSIPATNFNRFSTSSDGTDKPPSAAPRRRLSLSNRSTYTEGTDKQPCAAPCRRLSLSNRSTYTDGTDKQPCAAPCRRLSLSNRSTYTDGTDKQPCATPRSFTADVLEAAVRAISLGSSSHHKSYGSDLDYRGSGHRLRSSSHHKSSIGTLSSHYFTGSSSSSLDYNSSKEWGQESSYFLEEENLDFVQEVSDESGSSYDPIHGDADCLEYEERLNDEKEDQGTVQRQNLLKNVFDGYSSGSGLSSQSLDLLDVFEV